MASLLARRTGFAPQSSVAMVASGWARCRWYSVLARRREASASSRGSAHRSVYATQAKASVGPAVAIGSHAPGASGQLLIDIARQAFVIRADRAVLVAIAAAVLGAAAAAAFLPVRRPGQPAGHAAAEAPSEPALVGATAAIAAAGTR